jgi:uncharacterized repeat protein (TIGR03803 family)
MAIMLTQLQPKHLRNVRRIAGKLVALTAVALTCGLAANALGNEKVLYAFKGKADGSGPDSSLISDNAGNLYGTTYAGGTYGFGTVFKLSHVSGHWKETVLYSFSGGSDGKNPMAGVVMDSAGNLYGTTVSGGLSNCLCGVVFKLDPSGVETVIFGFDQNGGDRPTADLLLDSQGNLFGTAQVGGAFDQGVVFEMIPQSHGTWTENVVYSFTRNSGDGTNPMAGLVQDKAGNLYGTTNNSNDGFGHGTVFELKRNGNTWTESVLYQFTGGSDGGAPEAGVTIHDGKLYGTTPNGGIGAGVAFQLQPVSGGWKESVIYTFSGRGRNAVSPFSGLIFDKSGNAFGTTAQGGWRYCDALGCGTVYKLTPQSSGTWQESVLYRFDGPGVGDGEYPTGSRLLQDAKGHLYGPTVSGGRKSCGTGCGVVFEVSP